MKVLPSMFGDVFQVWALEKSVSFLADLMINGIAGFWRDIYCDLHTNFTLPNMSHFR